MLFISSVAFSDFKFAVMGDSRGRESGINQEVLRKILQQVKREDVEFIVFVGDMITGLKQSDKNRKRLLKWTAIVQECEIPVYIVVGNHEAKTSSSEDMLRSIFEMPQNGPNGLKELVYSFDYKNVHFVVLDTNIYNNFHRIGDVQLEWLRGDLEKNENRVIFVFGHEPAYPIKKPDGSSLARYPSRRDELWKIFQENSVAAYFCGHEHLYNRSVRGSIYQIITGGAGARFHASSEEGGFYHYLISNVKDDGTCEVNVKDITGKIRDVFVVTGEDI